MIGYRYDPLTERWVVLLMPVPAPTRADLANLIPSYAETSTTVAIAALPIAWKQTEAEAEAFAMLYTQPGEHCWHNPPGDIAPPATLPPIPPGDDGANEVRAAIDLAMQGLDRPRLVYLATVALKLVTAKEEQEKARPLEPEPEQ